MNDYENGKLDIEALLPRVLASWYGLILTIVASFAGLLGLAEPLGFTTGAELFAYLVGLSLLLGLMVRGWVLFLRERHRVNELIAKHAVEADGLFISELKMINDIVCVREQLSKSRCVRIFASGSETYRLLLLSLLPALHLKERLELRVLVRDDGSPSRKAKLSEAISKWHDIDEKFNTRTIVRTYDYDVMFRGWIFDQKAALVGWYERRNGKTCGQDDLAYFLQGGNKQCDSAITVLTRVFDKYFDSGNDIGSA